MINAVQPSYTVHDERFRRMILGNTRLETLGEGFGWAEGPVWFADQQALIFSDVTASREWRWSEGGGISLFRQPSDHANGHARDPQGRLLTCSHGLRAVVRTELDGTQTILADRFQGRRLNSPNDIVCTSDGSVWFTDPLYGIETDFEGTKSLSENAPAVYRRDPSNSEIFALTSGIAGPNGLAFSSDESVFYVSETGDQFAAETKRSVRRFSVQSDLCLADESEFAVVTPGYADGIAVDEADNLWLSAGDGVHCYAPDGAPMGRIHTSTAVTNLCFGGRELARLFLCAGHELLAINVNVRGARLV